jgi:sarcosine oxidase subunit alpha
VNSDIVLEEGAQLVADPRQPVPMSSVGHVTSSYWSPALQRSIALGMVKAGRSGSARRCMCRCRTKRSP